MLFQIQKFSLMPTTDILCRPQIDNQMGLSQNQLIVGSQTQSKVVNIWNHKNPTYCDTRAKDNWCRRESGGYQLPLVGIRLSLLSTIFFLFLSHRVTHKKATPPTLR